MLALVAGAEGQSSPAPDCAGGSPCPTGTDDPALAMFRHAEASRYWISGQDNVIFQYHPSFDAKYSGPKSLHSHAEDATSHVSTLYLGYALTHTTEVFLDLEEASGGGISDAQGLAGATNLDVVRNPQLSKWPYVGRVMVRQIIPLGPQTEKEARGTFALETQAP